MHDRDRVAVRLGWSGMALTTRGGGPVRHLIVRQEIKVLDVTFNQIHGMSARPFHF